MNDTDAPNLEAKDNSEDWKSWTPEVLLADLLHELRTPETRSRTGFWYLDASNICAILPIYTQFVP